MFRCKSFRESSTKCQQINWLPMSTDKTIGHFRVPKTLTFKMRLGAQPFSWKWVLFAWEWKMISISKAEHPPSFWNRGPRELGNGLLCSEQQRSSPQGTTGRQNLKKNTNTNHITPWSYLSVTKQGIDKEIAHYRVTFQASFWKRGKVRYLSNENNFLVVMQMKPTYTWKWGSW